MSAIKIILQARLNSSRLPGKMLLPIADIPLVVLCAKRAMTSGHPVIVATSTEKSDDPLAACLSEHNIPCTRGSLDDVLGRFIQASEGMKDNDLIVRLTGDNPFVDGTFVNAILDFHKISNTDYTRSLSPFDRLPYGVSAEVIRVGKLREIHTLDLSAEDREHVTIYPTKQSKYALFISPFKKDFSHLRATIDTQDDYKRIAAIFENINEDPIKISWQTLVVLLQKTPDTPAFKTPYKRIGLKAQSKLALGTAQLGFTYGIANHTGQPDASAAQKILETAISHGVTLIDTAAAYGASEKIIGESLNDTQKQLASIYTKLDPLIDLKENSTDREIKEAVEASVHKSCADLGLKTLPCLMLHRWDHYEQLDGRIWQALLDLKQKGIIKKLGASVQSPDEALETLNEKEIEFIQLPFNILDWRWRESGFPKKRKRRPDIHIQARSALLQGVFLLPADQWPILGSSEAEKTLQILQNLAKTHNRKSIQDLCYAYVRAADWVDSIVIGVETLEQLKENLDLFNAPELGNINEINGILPKVGDKFLNPAHWKQGA